jgi:Holliday junction DNA helicase RuvA
VIALLSGIVASRSDGQIVLDVHGVGYQVFIPANLEGELSINQEVRLHIHTNVREDAITLFGFKTTGRRDIFLSLNKVKGIGPKLSMTVLGSTTPAELLTAVSNGDVKRLTHIPGLGKKTAERILVELKEAFQKLLPEYASEAPALSKTNAGTLYDDLSSALTNLGYRPHAVDSALAKLQADADGTETFDALFREAMKLLR